VSKQRSSMEERNKVPDGSVEKRATPQRRHLTLVLGVGCLFGFASLIYLALLPSDVERRILGPYSLARMVLIAGMLCVSALLSWLTLKTAREPRWGDRAGFMVYGRKQTVPSLLVGSVVAGASILMAIVILWPELLLGLTIGHVERLLPYLALPVVLLTALGLTWWRHWSGVRVRVWPVFLDCGLAAVLFGLAVWARLPLTGYALPYQAVWDEVVTYSRGLSLLAGPDTLPVESVPGYGSSSYGDLLIYTTAAGQTAGLLSGLRAGEVASLNGFLSPPAGVGSVFEAVHVSGIPLRSPRVLLVLMNSASPILVFVVLRKYLGASRWASFAGGGIYAVLSPNVIYHSSFIVPDGLATTLSLGALVAAIAAIEDRSERVAPYVSSGLLVGLAMAVAIRYATLMVVPLAAVGLTQNHRILWRKLGSALGGIMAGFLVASPSFLLDFPSYLRRVTGLVWYGEGTVESRLASLVFYLRGMFAPLSPPAFGDSGSGSGGLGLAVLVIALLGLGVLLAKKSRVAVAALLFVGSQLYVVSPILQRYPRHVLVLYPIACILAGMGLDGGARLLARLLGRFGRWTHAPLWLERGWSAIGSEKSASAVLVLVLFVLLSSQQLRSTIGFVRSMASYETSQVQVARYLSGSLEPGDKVGILDFIPWVEQDLRARGIDFERIGVHETLSALRARGLTVVVGTDRFEDEYGSISGTIWEAAFDRPGQRLAEFGSDWMHYRGYPMGNIYLFAARLP